MRGLKCVRELESVAIVQAGRDGGLEQGQLEWGIEKRS